ncbi:DUF167 domain-containing protein [Patescibacteria group bacterium]|nr:DUF167 domain-containing protein [Patescibacteria group bacterium]MBU1705487.1 DUF167 domain-containing protein [Patescibacteria group bacterium]
MILTVHVKPRAKSNKVIAWLDRETVKVAVVAAPEKGRANEAVIKLLSQELKIAPSQIELIRGATTRMKQFEIPDQAFKNPA